MIKLTDMNGLDVYMAARNVASVNEAGQSSQLHGVRSIVRTFDGAVIECQQEARHVARLIAEDVPLDPAV